MTFKLKAILMGATAFAAQLAFTGAAHAQDQCGGSLTGASPELPVTPGADETDDLDFTQTGCGTNSDLRGGSYNVVVGYGASAADGSGHISIGAYSNAEGSNPPPESIRAEGGGLVVPASGNTAVGNLANASGNTSTNIALGVGAASYGSDSSNIAIGDHAFAAANGQSNVAIGSSAIAGGASTTAIGFDAQANGTGSAAYGYGTRANHTGSVAIGNGSITSADNTVSFGNGGLNRRLTNVAAGTIGATSTDAINGSQVFAISQTADAALATAEDAQSAAEDAYSLANVANSLAAGAQETADAAAADNIRQDGELDDIRTVNAEQDAALGDAAADNARQDGELDGIRAVNTRQDGEIATAQATADSAIQRSDALGASTAAALGGGSTYNSATGAVSAPGYSIGGQSYDNVSSAFEAVDGKLTQLDTRIDVLSDATDLRFRHTRGAIAAAMALGGTMIVPDSTVSVSFNLATYRGEQGFSGTIAVRAAPRIYLSGGIAGSTVRGSTGGRVGAAFGF